MTQDNEDPIKQAEARGYSRGYQAGRRRVEREDIADEWRGREERFRQEVFLVVLPALFGKSWGSTVNGEHKAWSSIREYVDGAFKFADEACKRTTFR